VVYQCAYLCPILLLVNKKGHLLSSKEKKPEKPIESDWKNISGRNAKINRLK
jgi:hypothetical protein